MATPAKYSPAKYYLAVRAGAPVGPHKLDSLREWVGRGAIGEDWQVCKEGAETWTPLSAIPRFSDYPKAVRERLDRFRQQSAREAWRSDPPTEKQLAKLRYFEIPFSDAGLTKGRASELIDAFISIDPERENEYQDRPSLGAQNKEIRSMGGDPDDLSYSEAKDLIDDLTREQEEKEIEWMILDNMLNDEDVHEICGYEHLSEMQLKQMLAYFAAHVPDWQRKSRFDLGKLVHQVLAARPVTASRSASRETIASVDTLPSVRRVPPKSTSTLPVAIAVVLGVIVVGAYLTYSRQLTADATHAAKSDSPAPTATAAAKTTAAATENFQTAVAASKKRALIAYPQLGVAGSPLNRAFVAEYKWMVKRNDPQLNNPNWPETVASRCALKANQ